MGATTISNMFVTEVSALSTMTRFEASFTTAIVALAIAEWLYARVMAKREVLAYPT